MLCNQTITLVIVITNVLHSRLPRIELTMWLLTDNVLTETTPKAANGFLAKMHALAELRGDLQRRHHVRDGEVVS